MSKLLEELERLFKPHLFIEFFFGHDKMFLSEHMQKKENYSLLLEEYGVFPDCRWLKEKLIHYQYKFNTVLPKLAYKHLNMVEYASPPSVNFLIE